MKTVTATEFRRNFALYQRHGQQEPIEVTSRGQIAGYFVSPEAFERYLRLSAAARRAYHPSELPAHLKHAVRVARMDPRHGPLNAVLDDE